MEAWSTPLPGKSSHGFPRRAPAPTARPVSPPALDWRLSALEPKLATPARNGSNSDPPSVRKPAGFSGTIEPMTMATVHGPLEKPCPPLHILPRLRGSDSFTLQVRGSFEGPMHKPASPIHSVSDTALWVAMYRAYESERPDAHFRDP